MFCCLLFGQLLTISAPVRAEIAHINLDEISSPSIAATPAELESNIDLALRVMINKKVYLYINEKMIKAAMSQGLIKDQKILLSQTKLIYMLTELSQDLGVLEKVLSEYKRFATEPEVTSIDQSKEQKTLLQSLDPLLEKIIIDPKVMRKLISKESHDQPLIVFDMSEENGVKKIKRVGYERMDFFSNHPRYENPDDVNSKIIPADNHKQVMIDLVNQSQNGDKLYFNFYDFDIKELAEALIQAKSRGVQVLGGVDGKVYQAKESVRVIIDDLNAHDVQVEKVDSVGLNHQKILVLKSQRGQSKTLFSSGNATQSCSGAEGDLASVPPELRPEHAIPNPNNMVLVSGEIPAVIALSEIKKNLVYKLRGQSEFPIGGAFQLMGPWDPELRSRDSMLIAFSPNGGLGNIGKDIYSKVFRAGQDTMEGAFFSFSSKDNLDQLFESIFRIIAIRRAQNLPAMDILKFVGDSQFALREFSNLLTLSGFKMVDYDPLNPFKASTTTPQNIDPENPLIKPTITETKKVYIKDNSDKRLKKLKSLLTKEEWQNWLDNIRVSPNWFMGGKVNYQGVDYPWQVKLHDKVIILPDQNISNPGSSINFSEAGESNQEQVIIVNSRRITTQMRGAVRYLFDYLAGKDNSVAREILRRNKKFSLTEVKVAYEVDDYRTKLENKTQCLKRYSKSAGIAVSK